MMRLISSIVILCSCLIFKGNAQDSVKSKRLKPLVITGSAVYAGSLIALDRLWYSDFERQSFTFFNDNSEWNQLDKLGHFYSAFHISKVSHRGLKWAGLREKKAILWGSLVSAIVLTPIEIMDGFSAEYGASSGDILANSLGALTFAGQQLKWGEVRVHVKYSFNRSNLASRRPELLGSNIYEEVIKDYNAHQHWLSIDISRFQSSFPKWLNIAVGYGATGMIYANDEQNIEAGLNPVRQFYLALDLDLNEYRSRSKFVNTVIYLVNMVKLPAPTLELSDGNFKFRAFHY